MTKTSKFRNRLAKQRQTSTTSNGVFEPKLVPRHDDAVEQKQESPLPAPPDTTPEEAVSPSAESLLGKPDPHAISLTLKRSQSTRARLQSWNNEGGKLVGGSSPQILSKAERRKNLRIWSRRKNLR